MSELDDRRRAAAEKRLRRAARELAVAGAAYWLVWRDELGRAVSVDFVAADRVRPSRRRRRPFRGLGSTYYAGGRAELVGIALVVIAAWTLLAWLWWSRL